jgi:predicted metal-dependent phosphoesterase TrpH
MKADLHIHSTVSDGVASIPEIIDMAEARGLDAIAITDHDTFSHITQTPISEKLKIIPGLEISAIDKSSGRHVHILGYNIQEPDVVKALTQPLLEARHRNTLRQITVLKDHGFEIDIGKLKPADGKYLYKQHVLDYLVSTGQADEMFGSFYVKTFKNKGICHFDIPYIDALDAVAAVSEAGGSAVLAHPGQQQNLYLVPALVRLGLHGLEFNHPSNSESDKNIIREYAGQYSLFLTGGSDYHGKFERPDIGVGDYLSDESGVEALCRL